MRELDGWLWDEYQRYLEGTGVAPATVKGKLSAVDQLLQYCASIVVVDEELPEKLVLPNYSQDDATSDEDAE